MPYLVLYSAPIPLDQKRRLVTAFTDLVCDMLGLQGEDRSWCTIHFVPIAPENVAIGGKLVSDGTSPDYHFEFRSHDIGRKNKRRMAAVLTETLVRELGLRADERLKVNVLFRDYDPRDFAVGGSFLHHLFGQGLRKLVSRITGENGTRSHATV
jgi:phenylpyruvate tautomerase PptA (4-oxalocrotonate tautomerase family)